MLQCSWLHKPDGILIWQSFFFPSLFSPANNTNAVFFRFFAAFEIASSRQLQLLDIFFTIFTRNQPTNEFILNPTKWFVFAEDAARLFNVHVNLCFGIDNKRLSSRTIHSMALVTTTPPVFFTLQCICFELSQCFTLFHSHNTNNICQRQHNQRECQQIVLVFLEQQSHKRNFTS